MPWMPRPRENAIAAVRLGFKYDQTTTSPDWVNAQNIMLIGGVLPPPPVEVCYRLMPGESDLADEIKKFSNPMLDMAWQRLDYSNEEMLKAKRDLRFSDQGRKDALDAVFKDWMGKRYVTPFVNSLDAWFFRLNNEIGRVTAPPVRDPKDAAGAVLDSEYRALVRAIPSEAKRFVHLLTLSLKEPDSPILAAALRADAAAVGIDKEKHDLLKLRFGMGKNARDLRDAWAAACALDALTYVVLHGTTRLATAAGKQHGDDVKGIIEAIENSPERAKMAATIESMVQATMTVNVPTEADEVEA